MLGRPATCNRSIWLVVFVLASSSPLLACVKGGEQVTVSRTNQEKDDERKHGSYGPMQTESHGGGS